MYLPLRITTPPFWVKQNKTKQNTDAVKLTAASWKPEQHQCIFLYFFKMRTTTKGEICSFKQSTEASFIRINESFVCLTLAIMAQHKY